MAANEITVPVIEEVVVAPLRRPADRANRRRERRRAVRPRNEHWRPPPKILSHKFAMSVSQRYVGEDGGTATRSPDGGPTTALQSAIPPAPALKLTARHGRVALPWGYTPGLHQRPLACSKTRLFRGFLEAVLIWRRGRDSRPQAADSHKTPGNKAFQKRPARVCDHRHVPPDRPIRTLYLGRFRGYLRLSGPIGESLAAPAAACF